jgi:penicillin-binding protein 1C
MLLWNSNPKSLDDLKEGSLSYSPNRWIRFLLILLFAVLMGGLFFLRFLPWLLPYSGQEALDNLRFSSVVLDSQGKELQVTPLDKGLRRIYANPSQLPPYLEEIVLQSEDRRFYWHPGVDILALVRAFIQNSEAGSQVSGASTLTMQLARILQPRPRTFENKIAEAWEALQLETRLSKEQILLYYINLLPFGFNIEGFATASRVFFDKPLSDLDPLQIKTLAVIPRSPQKYNPHSQPQENWRAVVALSQSLNEATEPPSQPPELGILNPSRPNIWPFRAPHFVQFLTTRPEWKTQDTRHPFQTTLEPDMQQLLEQRLRETVEAVMLRGGRISNGAGLFVRPDTMTVAAYVGSVEFFKENTQGQIDGVQIRRQPGSTLKPFLYALAMTKGFTASTILPDIPSDFGGQEIYTPSNYNQQFNGPIRLRQALASSLNIPAVYTLNRVGVLPFTDFLISTGIQSLESQRGHLGLGLSLGNAEIRLWELVQAYGLFLKEGRPIQLKVRREDATSPGNAGLTTSPNLDPKIAHLVRDILVRHPDRTLAFGRRTSRMTIEGALKTGTSNQFNNIWAVGFTPQLLGGIWMGNFDGATVISSPGAGLPAGILSTLLQTFTQTPAFPPLEGYEKHRICTLSGLLATPDCPHTIEEWFLPGTAPQPCTWHRPGSPRAQYPQEYSQWLSLYRYRSPDGFQNNPLSILRPRPNSRFFRDPTIPQENQSMQIEALGQGVGRVFIGDNLIHQGPFPLRFWWPLEPGRHVLKIEDEITSKSLEFEVR